jgi:Tol biopolymer transport system component
MDANGCNQVVLPMPKGTTHVDSMDADVPNWQGADDPTWSPDGEKIAIVGMKGAIYEVDADGSNPTPVFDAAGVQVSEPVWQPLP